MLYDPHELRLEALNRAAKKLTGLGARVVLPADLATAQSTWPESCPLSEVELKDALRSLGESIGQVLATAKSMLDRLPDPAEYAYEDLDEVPRSVYCHLHVALTCLIEHDLSNVTDELEKSLAATPTSLQETWLESILPLESDFRRLLPPVSGSEG